MCMTDKFYIYRSELDDDGKPIGEEYKPEDVPNIPCLDIQLIIVIDKDHGWRTVAKNDYYIWDDRGDGLTWWGVDLFGCWDYLFTRPGMKKVLSGRTISHDLFNLIFMEAQKDTRLPEKTAYWAEERKP